MNPKRRIVPPKFNRLEKYKMQFSAFESKDSDKESGNRLILVGAFDQNDVVELDFGEPMSLEISHVGPGSFSSATISEEPMCASLSSGIYNSDVTESSTKSTFQATSSVSSIEENEPVIVNRKSEYMAI
ncbi:uncharacterized protein CEXT_681421 [Caerostris extrusa]|uniref:Uncharacterized protein n=1 Tax=Caerostris extrusa TaxID=172846 RepID=A0AAV4RE87_CAEEX|nr:uncharacterized protein CEXT_681421 [Caerostris extrusa]